MGFAPFPPATGTSANRPPLTARELRLVESAMPDPASSILSRAGTCTDRQLHPRNPRPLQTPHRRASSAAGAAPHQLCPPPPAPLSGILAPILDRPLLLCER